MLIKKLETKIKYLIKDINEAPSYEKIRILINAGVFASVGWIYYHSFYASIIGACVSVFTLNNIRRRFAQKRREQAYVQFREFLQSVSSSVSTGNSFEQALKLAPYELNFIWSDRRGVLIKELNKMASKMEINYDVERALEDFCKAIEIEEAIQFSNTYKICRQMGGNLIQAMQSCVQIISDKLLTLQEIEHVLSQRKMEQKLLMILPHIFLVFLTLTAGDFISPLFTTVIGRMGATVSLLLVCIATFVSGRIVNIKV